MVVGCGTMVGGGVWVEALWWLCALVSWWWLVEVSCWLQWLSGLNGLAAAQAYGSGIMCLSVVSIRTHPL